MTVIKQLATMEDLAQGVGKVTQERSGTSYELGKVGTPYVVETEAELSAIDVTMFSFARIVVGEVYTNYRYNANDTSGVPSTGPGTWIIMTEVEGLDIGDYSSDPLITKAYEYAVFDRSGTPSNWRVKAGVSLPYQIDSTTYPTPQADPNLQAFQDLTKEQADLTYTPTFSSVAAMVSNASGVLYAVGMSLAVQTTDNNTETITNYVVSTSGAVSRGDVDLGTGFWARKAQANHYSYTSGDPYVLADPVNLGTPSYIANNDIIKHAQYGFLDNSVVDYDGSNAGNQARAAFNDKQQNIGSADIDHCHSYQTTVKHNHTGTTKGIHSFWTRPIINSGTVEVLTAFNAIFTDIDPSATIDKQIGVNLGIQPSKAATTYGIYSYYDLDYIMSGTIYLGVDLGTGEKDPNAPNISGTTGGLRLNSKSAIMQFDSPTGYNFIGPTLTLSPTFTGVRYPRFDVSDPNYMDIRAPLFSLATDQTTTRMRLSASHILPHEEDSLGPGTLTTPTNLGTNAEPFGTLYYVNPLVQVSDKTKKTDVRDLSEKERAVALECKGMVKSYKLIKGDNKIHFGLMAQDVFEVFKKHGLNPDDYNVVEHDNGKDYGLCYTALMCMIIGAI